MKKIYNVDTALTVADAFRNHSKMFIDSLPKENFDVALKVAENDFGGLIASVTMLAFALELYLKALRIKTDLPVPEEHDLLKLYKNLSKELKQSIENQYNKSNTERAGNLATHLFYEINIKPSENNSVNNAKIRENIMDDKLESVLKRSKDAFDTWRYIYEEKDAYVKYNYEFYHLDLICEITRSHLTTSI